VAEFKSGKKGPAKPVAEALEPRLLYSADPLGTVFAEWLHADGDGMISSAEAAADADLRKDWDTADVNQDGQLERAEFSALEEKSKAATDK